MAKGEDAVMRKKNKILRKRLRGNENAVSTRVAAIIATKRRRKSGQRRMCEGMCFSLPTPDDPFNDYHKNKTNKEKKKKKTTVEVKAKSKKSVARTKKGEVASDVGCLSKFLISCLNAIRNEFNKGDEDEREHGEGDFIASSWGVEFWRKCVTGLNIVETSSDCASEEQLAWVVSTASDLITRKDKEGALVSSPFLLFLVPSQEKAVEVRSMCKPLKALGVHTISLHAGASIDHQIRGLKSCEPEFLISTPERLCELLSLRAIDISGVSLLVLDGLKHFLDLSDKVKSIQKDISGQPQVVIFGDSYEEASATLCYNTSKTISLSPKLDV